MKKTYKIVLEKRVSKKDLATMPAKDRFAILATIASLAENPYPVGCTKLTGYKPDTYRVRQGVYRVLYQVRDDVIEVRVVHVGHRKEIYKKY